MGTEGRVLSWLIQAAAWAILLIGWGTLLAAAFRVRIARRYRIARYAAAAGAAGYLWWQDHLPDAANVALILSVAGLTVAGWVLALRWR